MNNVNENTAISSISTCKEYLQTRKQEIEEALWKRLPKPLGLSERLYSSICYPMESGGKRIRPLLVLIAADFCRGVAQKDVYEGKYWDGVDNDLRESLLTVASAIEMIHTYSLIHDDLPCMDDDDLRRGRPTTHIVFGEAMAVLSADALQTLGFQLITGIPSKFATRGFHAAHELAIGAGHQGMVVGQAVDVEYESKPGNEEVLEFIHLHKTAALIRSALLMGAQMVEACKEDYELLSALGYKLGLIFQVVDDILDVEGDTALLGKKTGADQNHEKLTYPSLIGLDESKKRVQVLHREIQSLLHPTGERGLVLLDFSTELAGRQF